MKSATLLMDAVEEFENPNLRAVIFRESMPQLRDLILKAYRLYRRYPYFGRYNKTEHIWTFPTNASVLADEANIELVARGHIKPVYVDGEGGSIKFAFMDNDDRTEDHQGQEYSFVGFDESTHHTEYQIQYMLTRLRSTDPTLRLRMRLATNPGGEGHRFHMKVFIGDVCPHCQPNSPKARKPYVIYTDACWSDGTPLSQIIDGVEVKYTTQFIPGRLIDHDLFGKGNVTYRAQLRMQRPTLAKALEEGCWAIFEGQYFTMWEENRGTVWDAERQAFLVPKPDMRMAIPACDMPEIQYWWPHFVGADYGFSISQAAAYLCVRTPADQWFPNGRIYVMDEYCQPGRLTTQFATDLLQRWFLRLNPVEVRWEIPDPVRSIQMWALSPDAWIKSGAEGDNGVALSRADQMQELFAKYNFSLSAAANDRAGGWMHMARMMRSGELVIVSDRCPKMMEAIPTAIRDDKKEDDIKKIAGSELDDCLDALRYALYSWLRVGRTPVAVELEQRVKDLDPTSAMIQRAKFAEEVAKRSAPIFVGRGARMKQMLALKNKKGKNNF